LAGGENPQMYFSPFWREKKCLQDGGWQLFHKIAGIITVHPALYCAPVPVYMQVGAYS